MMMRSDHLESRAALASQEARPKQRAIQRERKNAFSHTRASGEGGGDMSGGFSEELSYMLERLEVSAAERRQERAGRLQLGRRGDKDRAVGVAEEARGGGRSPRAQLMVAFERTRRRRRRRPAERQSYEADQRDGVIRWKPRRAR